MVAAPNNLLPSKKNSPSIFLVDDDERSMETADAILHDAGYSTATFSDAQTALESFSKLLQKPQLLITDYSMAQMNGVELMDRCRRLVPDLKVILISGTLDEISWSKFPFKVDAFISKPFNPRKMASIIESVLRAPDDFSI